MASAATLSFLLFASYSLLATATCTASDAVSSPDLHFYMHDDYAGPTQSAVRVVSGHSLNASTPTSPRQFGDVVAFSNALTAGPGLDTARVGTAQGFAVRVAERGTVSDLSMHLVMEDGSGSVDVKGRIDIEQAARQATVIGGAGRFLGARGYVTTRNYGQYDLATGGVVEIFVYLVQ
ncbi:hypothetical protein ACP70R_002682 [Stipagrostis hirtigluma subsp. patula]